MTAKTLTRQTFLFPTGQSLYTGTVTSLDGDYLTLTDARRTGWGYWETPTPGELEDVDISATGATVLGGSAVVWLLEDGDLDYRDYPQNLTAEDSADRAALLARLSVDARVVVLTATQDAPADDIDADTLAYVDTLTPSGPLYTMHLAETVDCPACTAPTGQPCKMGGFGGTLHPRRALAVRDIPAADARTAVARLFTARKAAIAAL